VGLTLLVLAFAAQDFLGPEIRSLERENLRDWIHAAGLLGPVLVVLLMMIAIVASPLPSAPIALAAGAAYGHTFGTLLVVLGAELGALAAFLLARPFVERRRSSVSYNWIWCLGGLKVGGVSS
jgi:uncharacterized membrane protein YdjX (TVP38/TMEM64 family)